MDSLVAVKSSITRIPDAHSPSYLSKINIYCTYVLTALVSTTTMSNTQKNKRRRDEKSSSKSPERIPPGPSYMPQHLSWEDESSRRPPSSRGFVLSQESYFHQYVPNQPSGTGYEQSQNFSRVQWDFDEGDEDDDGNEESAVESGGPLQPPQRQRGQAAMPSTSTVFEASSEALINRNLHSLALELASSEDHLAPSKRKRPCPICEQSISGSYLLRTHLENIHSKSRVPVDEQLRSQGEYEPLQRNKRLNTCGYCCTVFTHVTEWAKHIAYNKCEISDTWLVENQVLSALRFYLSGPATKNYFENLATNPEAVTEIVNNPPAQYSSLKEYSDALEASPHLSDEHRAEAVALLAAHAICVHQILDLSFVASRAQVSEPCPECIPGVSNMPQGSDFTSPLSAPPFERSRKKEPSKKTIKDEYKCRHCDRTFDQSEKRWKHEQQAHTQQVQCKEGGHWHKSAIALKDHMKRRHKKYQRVPCPAENCTDDFADEKTKNKHVLKNHPELAPAGKAAPERVQCEHCQKTFDSPGNLKRHVKSQHEGRKKDLSCPVDGCDSKFGNPDNIYPHIKKFHPEVAGEYAKGRGNKRPQ